MPRKTKRVSRRVVGRGKRAAVRGKHNPRSKVRNPLYTTGPFSTDAFGPSVRAKVQSYVSSLKDPQKRDYARVLFQSMAGGTSRPPIPYFMEVASAVKIRQKLEKIVGGKRNPVAQVPLQGDTFAPMGKIEVDSVLNLIRQHDAAEFYVKVKDITRFNEDVVGPINDWQSDRSLEIWTTGVKPGRSSRRWASAGYDLKLEGAKGYSYGEKLVAQYVSVENPAASTFTEIGYYDSDGYHIVERLTHGTPDSDTWLRAQQVSRELGHPVQLIGRGVPVTVSAGGVTVGNPVDTYRDPKTPYEIGFSRGTVDRETGRRERTLDDMTFLARDHNRRWPDGIQLGADDWHQMYDGYESGWKAAAGSDLRGMEWEVARTGRMNPEPMPMHKFDLPKRGYLLSTNYWLYPDMDDETWAMKGDARYIGGGHPAVILAQAVGRGLKDRVLVQVNYYGTPYFGWVDKSKQLGRGKAANPADNYEDEDMAEDFDAEPMEPEEGDWVTEDYTTFREQGGRGVVRVPEGREWEAVLRLHMKREQYWPNVWQLSDHGNYELLSMKVGNPIGGFRPGIDSVSHFRPRFVHESQMAELANLWHLSHTHSNSRWERMQYTSKWFAKEHPELTATAVYKDLDAWLAFNRMDNPAASPEQYRLAQAVLSGTARGHMPEHVAREIVDRTPAGMRSEYGRRNPAPTTLSKLSVGDKFHFYKHSSGMASGPWIKTSARKYREWPSGEYEHRVGTVSVKVIRPGEEQLDIITGRRTVMNPADGAAVYAVGDDQLVMEAEGLTQAEAVALLKRRPLDDLGRNNYIWKSMGTFAGDPTWKRITVRRSNPAYGAAALYEEFHGVPSESETIITEEIQYHGNLAELGTLVEIKVKTLSGYKAVLAFESDPPLLCSSEDGKQLYIRGGDQSLDLDALHMNGDEWVRDSMVIGPITEITYRTRKKFDGLKKLEYFHKAGEETGVRPDLIYDVLNNQLSVSGGQYSVEGVGVVN